MEPKVLLTLIIVALALLIDVPMVALHTANINVTRELIKQEIQTRDEVVKTRALLELQLTPTVTPITSVTPTPTKSPVKSSSTSAR